MAPGDYADWLNTGTSAFQSPAGQGRKLFQQYGCVDCHETGHAPPLQGLFGQPVLLSDGSTVIADENYIRQKLITPGATIPAGFQPIMPSFAGRLSEQDILNLIAYIKSIGPTSSVPQRQPVLPVPSVVVAYPSPSSEPPGGANP
jgi:cytochrome c oxidase subunit II